MRHHAALVALASVLGCAEGAGGKDSRPVVGEVVPATTPEVVPGTVVAERYWAEIHPREGRLQLFRLHPGNVIVRDEAAVAAALDYGGGPLAQTGTESVALFTDQSKVIYHDVNDRCWSNGQQVACPATGPCSKQNEFCGPIGLSSTYQRPLTNVVVQLAQLGNQQNAVNGCRDDATRPGLCKTIGPAKVDAPTSNLTSPIPGDPSAFDPTYGCSYCYGNPSDAQAAGLPGLANAVLRSSVAGNINSETFVLELQNDADFGIDIVVRASLPTLAPPGQQIALSENGQPVACARAGTKVTVTGGGFGPPGPCLQNPLLTCPLSGPPGEGYGLLRPGDAPFTAVTWSDTLIEAIVPAHFKNGALTVLTPWGALSTQDQVALCAQFPVAGLENVAGGGTALVSPSYSLQLGQMTRGGGMSSSPSYRLRRGVVTQ
jgi:hypothetical protein